MSTVADYYSDRVDIAPVEASDPDLLEDISFGDYATTAEFTTANTEWSVVGSPTWSTDGVKVTAAGSVIKMASTPTWLASLITAEEGTIYMECERAGLTVDESDISTKFLQSSGRVNATDGAYLMAMYFNRWDTKAHFFRGTKVQAGACFTNLDDPTAAEQNLETYMNSQPKAKMTTAESDIATVAVTWKGLTVQTLIDGLPVNTTTLGEIFGAAVFGLFAIGNDDVSATRMFGDYNIKRLQVTKRHSLLVANPMRLAFIGDSFMKAYTDSVDITQLSDIGLLYDGTGGAGTHAGLAEFIRLFAVNHNFVLTGIRAGIACENQSGWATDFPNTIDSTQTDHIIAYDPEILITAGSINDVNTVAPAVDIYTDTKTILDTLIDGCRSLREVHFFEQFAGHQGSLAQGADHIAEYKRLSALQSALNGYQRSNAAGETCTVFFHETYDAWGGDDYDVNLSGAANVVNVSSISGNGTTVTVDTTEDHNLGTSSVIVLQNTGTSHDGVANNVDSVTDVNTFTFLDSSTDSSSAGTCTQQDIHPSSLGHVKMAEIKYDAIQHRLSTIPILTG